MISELTEMLEKATGPDRALDCWLWVFAKGGDARMHYVDGDAKQFVWERGVDGFWVRDIQNFGGTPRYTASIDAAVDLCSAVLPKWGYSLSFQEQADASVWEKDAEGNYVTGEATYQVPGATPAIGLCLAILKAKQGADAKPSPVPSPSPKMRGIDDD